MINRVFKRTFCSQMSRLGYVSIPKSTMGFGVVCGGGAFAGLSGMVFLYSTQIQGLEAELTEQKTQFADLSSAKAKGERKAAMAEKEMKAEIADKSEMLSLANMKLADTEAELSTTSSKLEETSADLDSKKRSYNALQRSAGELRQKSTQLKSGLESCNKKGMSKEERIARLQRENATLKSELKFAQQRQQRMDFEAVQERKCHLEERIEICAATTTANGFR